jgi:serine/threonine protein kinase
MGFAHRDLKPENILLSREFVLKVADFGFATIMEGKNKSGILHTNLGSEGYKAPEIYKKQYVGWQTDVFAAGVILFIMLKGTPPFDSANPEDRVYNLIKDKNYKHFWKIHSQKHPKLFSQ